MTRKELKEFVRKSLIESGVIKERFTLKEEETGDHEVGMAINLLDDIIMNAQSLKGKIGTSEKNLAGWIQDHISQAQNYINQANTGYHEIDNKEEQK